jgi:FAD/FMN-containing dehydrogenase
MSEHQTIPTGGLVALDDATVQDFRVRLRGDLLRPSDEGYDTARKIHNGMFDRYPALIARCAGVADVIASVQFARDHQLLISVRGGGHGLAGFALCDGGLMIDLSRMKSVQVDPTRQTARAEGGATWGDFDHETQALGLATTGGVARPTGIAGLTLGGGHGYLMRRFGLACDNLLSVDLITAEGRLVRASADEHADLYWGLRGGGGNFGVATAFEYQLHPVGPILGGLLIYPLAHAKDVLRRFRDVTSTAPDDLGVIAVLGTLPDGTQAVVILVGYSGPVAEGERLLRPLREPGLVLADQVGPMPYTALQSIVENFNPAGMRNYWKSDYLAQLGDEVIDLLVEYYPSVPIPHTHVAIEHLGGAVTRVDEDAMAVSHRAALYNAIIVGMWGNPAQDEQLIAWVRRLWEQLRPFSFGGVYVNYLSNEGEDRVRAAYSPKKFERLGALKNEYDPTNLFRLNQNIRPTISSVTSTGPSI